MKGGWTIAALTRYSGTKQRRFFKEQRRWQKQHAKNDIKKIINSFGNRHLSGG